MKIIEQPKQEERYWLGGLKTSIINKEKAFPIWLNLGWWINKESRALSEDVALLLQDTFQQDKDI